MAWGKIDDQLHASEKWRAASKGARALWASALSWCADRGNGGVVPTHMVRALDGTPGEAKNLVAVRLWDEHPQGYRFHDWDDYNEPAAAAQARKDRRKKASDIANHNRWHKDGRTAATCTVCFPSDSDSASEGASDTPSDPISDIPPESDMNPPVPVPVPHDLTETSLRQSSSRSGSDSTDAIEISRELEQRAATVYGITSIPAIIKQITEQTGRQLNPTQALQVSNWLLSKAKGEPRIPQRYVIGAITQSPFEVQQHIDEAVML